MRSVFVTLMFVMLSMAVYSQNGGQSPENNSVKLEFAGSLQTRLYNKQSCTAIIRVSYNNVTTDYTVPGNSSILLSTPVASKITAKATTNCGSADFGNVELTLTLATLPVKFVSFSATPQGKNKVLIQFEVAESTDVQQFNVQLSKNGINWQTVTIIWPDDLMPNKVYKAMIDLNQRVSH